MPKVKTKKKASVIKIKPLFPQIVVQRVTKDEGTSTIIVTRMEKEETAYAIVYEVGENEDFKRGDVIAVHPHCGHDFTWKDKGKDLSLTFIHPDDILCEVEGTPEELKEFLSRAKREL